MDSEQGAVIILLLALIAGWLIGGWIGVAVLILFAAWLANW